jgi:SAM-dependent methyltransferase
MGLPQAAMRLLLDECVRKRFSGSVATLGRQHIYFPFSLLQASAEERQLVLSEVEVRLHREPALAKQKYISDETFLKAIGFTEVSSIDFSDFEQADILVDLNREIPLELHHRFDVIIDGGTLEHLFHLPQALKNLYSMLRPGGRIIHLNPAGNYIDHGFFTFSPTFFWDFYTANGYEVERAILARIPGDSAHGRWEISNYVPGSLDSVATGGLDDSKYQFFFIATKTDGATGDRIPQQGYYRKTWNPPDDSRLDLPPRGDRILAMTKGIPVVNFLTCAGLRFYRASLPTVLRWKQFFLRKPRSSRLKVVAKY